MSKKMLKRSLALGALMAFVITGQAWAEAENITANVTKESINVANGEVVNGVESNNYRDAAVYVNAADLTVTGDITIESSKSSNVSGNRLYGIAVTKNASLEAKGSTIVNVTGGGNTDLRVIRINGEKDNEADAPKVTFNNLTVNAEGNSTVNGIDIWYYGKAVVNGNTNITVQGVPEGNYTIAAANIGDYSEVEFGGDTTYLKAVNNGGGIAQTVAPGLQYVGGPRVEGTKAVFKSKTSTTIEAVAKSSAIGIAYIDDVTFENGVVNVNVTNNGTDSNVRDAIGIKAGNAFNVTNGVSDFNITVNGSGLYNGDFNHANGTAGLFVDTGSVVNINSQNFNIVVTGNEKEFDNRDSSYGIKAVAKDGKEVGDINITSNTTVTVTDPVGRAYGVYGEKSADINLADTTITATSKEGRAYGVWVDESTIDIADTTITATSENSRAVGIAAANSGNEVYVDGDITINATAGERADGMNLDYSDIDVAGKLTVDATGETDDYQIGAQGVRLAYSTATFTDVDISAKSTTTGKVYGIRMLGDDGATNTQLAISGNADVYAETNGVAYGIVVSTGADLGVEDDLSDIGKNLNVTVIGKEEASAIRAQYGSDINVSANTDVDIVATSESGKAYGVVNSYLTYDSVNYAKAKANISILGNVNIEANGKTGSYAVYNSTDHKKEVVEEVGKTVIGGEGKLVTITGDMYANSGSITTTFGAEGSKFDGKVETVEKGTTTLNFAKGATWNLTSASTLTNATFDAGSVLNLVDAEAYKAKIGKDGKAILGADAGTYAITAAGTETGLTVDGGAKLQITDIEETTYNIAAGFAGYENVAEKIDIADNALLQAEKIVSDGTNGAKYYQVEVKAKEADQMAADIGISESTAGLVETIIQNANSDAAKVDGSPEQAAVEFIQNVMNENGSDNAAVGNAINAATKMGEAGGNSATAASIVKNVTGVTNDRLSFNCGHSAPHKGGHGVGLFEEGSGADIWVEYVHGKDEVEDMPSTAGKTSYEGQYNGIVMGVDFKKVNKFQSGIAFNYGEGDTNSLGSSVRTHSDYDFWGVGYYGNIHNDDSNVIFDINYAKTDSDVTQYNSGSTLEASPETTTWSAGVKLEKLYQNESVQIVPYTGLRYMSIDADDYSTKKGEFYYSMDRQDIWLLPVGVSIRQEVANDNGWTVSPRVDLSYIWAFGDTNSNMEVKSPFPGVSQIGYDVMDDGSFLGLVGIEAHKGQWGYGVAYSYQKGDHSESKKWYVDVNYSF